MRPPLTATLGKIPDGVAGVRATLNLMSGLVKAGKTDMGVRGVALGLTGGLMQKDCWGEAEALHAFVRDNIRYVMDVTEVETVQSPIATLTARAGDCDDKSTLLCALLESIGHPTRFVAVGRERNEYCHVYCEVCLSGDWIPLETTEPVEMGWEPPPEVVMARLVVEN